MGYLSEKYNYVRGLCDGIDISAETKEGKVLLAIMELLDDIVLSVEELEDAQDETEELLDEMDEDLADLEEFVYQGFDEEFDDIDDEDVILEETECPKCNTLIELSEDIFSEDGEYIVCPNCQEHIEIDWECDCEECSKDCEG